MPEILFKSHAVITVFGASGDLAKKKTYPALFGLVCPPVGYTGPYD